MGWTIEGLAAGIRRGRICSIELVEECLSRIARLDGQIRAFVRVDAEGARRVAKERDAEAAAGTYRGPLHGIPLAYKDLCALAGLSASCGTRISDYLRGVHPCTVVSRLTSAGAVTLGTLNMAELALGSFGDNAHHGDVQNPWQLGRCSGGSSSGSAAAIAAGMVPGSLGTDTGGSIRLPAACCGIVGLKPTYGRISRAGLMPLSWSNDHVGPMARTIRDVAILLGIMAGADRADGTSSRRPVPDYLATIEGGIRGLRIGVPENYYFDGVDEEIARVVTQAVGHLRALGASVQRVQLPDPHRASEITTVFTRAESAAIHARVLRENPDCLQPVVRQRLTLGLDLSASEYLQALRLRAYLTRTFVRSVFSDVDLLVVPTTPVPPPPLAELKAGRVDSILERNIEFSRLTRPFNGLGLPALSIPCGFLRDGLPVGAQLVGRPFDEATILRAARAYERASNWGPRRASMSALDSEVVGPDEA